MESSIKDIKNAYKKLALIHHPDKPTGDSDKFQKITIAYEILSDEKKRRIYNIGFKFIDNNFNMNEYNFILLPKIFIEYLLKHKFNIKEFINHVYENYNLKNEILVIKKIWKLYKSKKDTIIINITLKEYFKNSPNQVLNNCIHCLNTGYKYQCKKCNDVEIFELMCDNFCNMGFIKINCDKCKEFAELYPQSKYPHYKFNIISSDDYNIVNNKDIYIEIKVNLYQWLFGDLI